MLVCVSADRTRSKRQREVCLEGRTGGAHRLCGDVVIGAASHLAHAQHAVRKGGCVQRAAAPAASAALTRLRVAAVQVAVVVRKGVVVAIEVARVVLGERRAGAGQQQGGGQAPHAAARAPARVRPHAERCWLCTPRGVHAAAGCPGDGRAPSDCQAVEACALPRCCSAHARLLRAPLSYLGLPPALPAAAGTGAPCAQNLSRNIWRKRSQCTTSICSFLSAGGYGTATAAIVPAAG